MNQERKPHFESSMAELESFYEEEIRMLQGYLGPVLEVRKKILSPFSNKRASSRLSVGEILDELMYVNLPGDLLQIGKGISECRTDFGACDMILYHKQPEHSYDSMKTAEQRYEGVAAMNLFYRELGDVMFYYNPDESNKGCVVIEKTISSSDEDFWLFGENIKQGVSFITDNKELQYFDQQMTLHCLFIRKKDTEFGVLISYDRKSGEVCSGCLPNLDQFQEIGCGISEKENYVEPQVWPQKKVSTTKLSAVQVKFETSEYLTLKRYVAEKEVSLEQKLEETLNRLYRELVPPDVQEYIEEGEKMGRVGEPKTKNEEEESEERQSQAEQPQDIQSV